MILTVGTTKESQGDATIKGTACGTVQRKEAWRAPERELVLVAGRRKEQNRRLAAGSTTRAVLKRPWGG